MNEQEFTEVSEQMLRAIESALENCGAALDFEWQGDGVLEISFENGSKVIVNRHNAAQEIWIAARSGGFHFKYINNHWQDARDQQTLKQRLSLIVSLQAEEEITLDI